MKTLEEIQSIALTMISKIGFAKSNFIEATHEARDGNFDSARTLISAGVEAKNEGHTTHFELIKHEAQGNELPFSLMLMHAEDQLLTAEVYLSLAEEAILLYQRISELERNQKDTH